MHFQNITFGVAAVAAVLVLGCTGTHEASAKSATPELQATTPIQAARASVRTPADTDTVARPAVAIGTHPTPPVLDSLMKGTLAARGLYVFRFGANTRRMKHLIGIADST
ncbi:MAG: hypothetical protein ACJ79F_10005, partial [Gemmatimonadaceae bacterium]